MAPRQFTTAEMRRYGYDPVVYMYASTGMAHGPAFIDLTGIGRRDDDEDRDGPMSMSSRPRL